MSEYDRVLNALYELDTLYNQTMSRMHEPVNKRKYKVTGNTRFVLIVMENEEYQMHWVCNTSICTNIGSPETLKEETTRSNRHLWKCQ